MKFLNAINKLNVLIKKHAQYLVFGITFIFSWLLIYEAGFTAKDAFGRSIVVQSIPFSGFFAIFPSVFSLLFFKLMKSNHSSSWLKPMIEIIVLVARVDGKITSKDKKIIEKSFNDNLGYFRIKKGIKYFEKIKDNQDLNLAKSCAKLMLVYSGRNSTILLGLVVTIALSDQFLSKKEELLLNEISERLGVHNSVLKSIMARRRYVSENKQKRTQSRPSLSYRMDKSYKILGIESSATLEEVKKAYRELAKIYHPDKIKDKALKENAKIQFQTINDAYEILKKKLG